MIQVKDLIAGILIGALWYRWKLEKRARQDAERDEEDARSEMKRKQFNRGIKKPGRVWIEKEDGSMEELGKMVEVPDDYEWR